MDSITTNSLIYTALTLIVVFSGIWLMKTIYKISSVLTLVMVPVIWLYCH